MKKHPDIMAFRLLMAICFLCLGRLPAYALEFKPSDSGKYARLFSDSTPFPAWTSPANFRVHDTVCTGPAWTCSIRIVKSASSAPSTRSSVPVICWYLDDGASPMFYQPLLDSLLLVQKNPPTIVFFKMKGLVAVPASDAGFTLLLSFIDRCCMGQAGPRMLLGSVTTDFNALSLLLDQASGFPQSLVFVDQRLQAEPDWDDGLLRKAEKYPGKLAVLVNKAQPNWSAVPWLDELGLRTRSMIYVQQVDFGSAGWKSMCVLIQGAYEWLMADGANRVVNRLD